MAWPTSLGIQVGRAVITSSSLLRFLFQSRECLGSNTCYTSAHVVRTKDKTMSKNTKYLPNLATPTEQHVCCIFTSCSPWLWKVHYRIKTNTAYYSSYTACLFCSVHEKSTPQQIMKLMARQPQHGRMLSSFFFAPK